MPCGYGNACIEETKIWFSIVQDYHNIDYWYKIHFKEATHITINKNIMSDPSVQNSEHVDDESVKCG